MFQGKSSKGGQPAKDQGSKADGTSTDSSSNTTTIPIAQKKSILRQQIGGIKRKTKATQSSSDSSTDITAVRITLQPRGLVNFGNTCFINSVMQLFNTNSFLHALLSRINQPVAKANFVSQFRRTMQLLSIPLNKDTQKQLHDTLRMTYSTSAAPFNNPHQHDAAEYYNFVYESLESHKLYNGPALNTVLTCRSQTFIQCLECETSTAVPIDRFSVLRLYFSQIDAAPLHLESMVQAYLAPETMIGVHAYDCTVCIRKTTATKTNHLVGPAPQTITIHLVRFSSTKSAIRKLNTPVIYTRSLELPFYDNGTIIQACYSLQAVIDHQGQTMESGHYVTYAKRQTSTGIMAWFKFNDTIVTKVTESEVLQPLHRSDDGVLQTPYMLLYTFAPQTSIAKTKHLSKK